MSDLDEVLAELRAVRALLEDSAARLRDQDTYAELRAIRKLLEAEAGRSRRARRVATPSPCTAGVMAYPCDPICVICFDAGSWPACLVPGKVYRVGRKQPGDDESPEMIRVIDEDSEDDAGYLYPAHLFVSI